MEILESRFNRLASFVIAIVFLSCSACAKEEWKTYTADNRSFSVLLPGSPKLDTTDQVSNEGYVQKTLVYSYDSHENSDKNSNYEIRLTVFPIPRDSINSPTFQAKILGNIGKSGSEFGFESKIKSHISKDGYPGIENVGEIKTINPTMLVRSRSFLTENGVLMAVVRTTPANDQNENMLKFFNSLKIINETIFAKWPERVKEEWKLCTSHEGGYCALFPGSPKKDKFKTQTETGDLWVHTLTYLPSDKSVNYSFGSQFLQHGYDISQLQTEEACLEFLAGIRNGFIETPGVELVKNSFIISKEGYYGLDLAYTINNGNVLVRTRYFLVDDKVLAATVNADPRYNDNEAMVKFLDSFSILER